MRHQLHLDPERDEQQLRQLLQHEVQVNDTNAPTIHCPADVVLECPADTSTNGTGVATALDDCGTVTVSYSDSSDQRLRRHEGDCAHLDRHRSVRQHHQRACRSITVRDTTAASLSLPGQCGAGMPGGHRHQQYRDGHGAGCLRRL